MGLVVIAASADSEGCQSCQKVEVCVGKNRYENVSDD